jgi:hypothetical protein
MPLREALGIATYGNPETKIAFEEEEMARDRIELPTRGFSVLCSTD